MRTDLVHTAGLYASALAAWAAWCAARPAPRPRLHDGGLVVLELALLAHATLGAAALLAGHAASDVPTYAGYLGASVVILPAVATGATDRASRWDSAVLALACLALAVVAGRLGTLANG